MVLSSYGLLHAGHRPFILFRILLKQNWQIWGWGGGVSAQVEPKEKGGRGTWRGRYSATYLVSAGAWSKVTIREIKLLDTERAIVY